MYERLRHPVSAEVVRARKQALTDRLSNACRELSPIVFATSLGAEDMVLTEVILRGRFPIRIFTLDTGRLPAETLALLGRIEQHYGTRIERYAPRPEAVEDYVRRFGIDGFYDSVEARRACCRVRKIGPLKEALTGQAAWITGLRAAQSVTRAQLSPREWDAEHGLEKLNPLADWSEREVWSFIKHYQVPYNQLHDQGYPSLGCAPCTRAITVGEDIRAGRWWWESPETKECGLHRKTAVTA
ncbi:adenylylsulfate reductase, thioredoxin dependent [Thiorhodococcus drewsii AZ1]|uniref:Adenosine 5'-phosphosulfate reductase n=1 Tax=Thiorhodococcus drewsii AZ1 TaxID=765913 RepID=G2DZR0_9GAMM|nr:phosphoadenylyl-sulfate reductase [Thiorhodococcus drewsii]EGV32287.1 adenylylsulfate reductase, thioredoxin dependent [Thiorhodococcus drewsii AZ1]